jgi:hypothetical protein
VRDQLWELREARLRVQHSGAEAVVEGTREKPSHNEVDRHRVRVSLRASGEYLANVYLFRTGVRVSAKGQDLHNVLHSTSTPEKS